MCIEPGCQGVVVARNYCRKHYQAHKLRKTFEVGSPSLYLIKKMGGIENINEETKLATCDICGPNTVILGNSINHKSWKCRTKNRINANKAQSKRRANRRATLKPMCEVCGTTKLLCWDHDHETDRFRGTLCRQCNSALGLVYEDAKILQGLIEYLASH